MKRIFGVALVTGLGLGLALWSPGCGKPSGSSNDRFELTVARSEMPADGVSKTAITAIVLDADGTPTKEGVTVVLESTDGTVEPASVAVAAGLASSSLTSSLNPGLVIISAHTEPEGLRAEAEVRFTEATASSLVLNCEPNVLEANGTSEALCTVELRLPNGDPVANGTVVNFTTTAGTLSANSATTSNGRATFSLRSTTNGATAVVQATSGSARDSVQVQFQENPPGRVEVRASRSEIQANGTDQTTITATVFASRGGFANDGTPVNCTTSAGTLSPTSSTTTDGVATTTLTSSTFETTAEVVCTAGNKVGRTRVDFVGSNTGEVATIRVTANPGTIRVGGQNATITVRVENASGDGVAGETVFLSVTGAFGTTISVSEADSDDNGRVTLTLRSGAGSGIATVTAEAGAQEGTANVTILPGQPNDFVPFTAPGTIVAGSSGEVNMVVVDSFRNPVVDGTIVQFSIVCPGGSSGDGCDGPTLSDSSKPTFNGSVSVTIRTTAETSETMVKFTASAGSISKPADIKIERGPTPTPTLIPTITPTPTLIPTITPTPTLIPTATFTPTPP